MKLLVIEDNKLLQKSLQDCLGKNFIVQTASNGEEGLYQAEAETYDLILLDLKLPDIDGDQVCKAIRRARIHTPILVLTANTSINSKVDLLNMGADDYLTKPFHTAELHARLDALLRRAPAEFSSNTLVVEDLILDPARRHVERSNTTIQLRRKEFDILEYLMRNKGKILTRAMIFNHVWESTKDNWSNTVDVHIKYLRDKADKPFPKHLIKTVYGIGYKIGE